MKTTIFFFVLLAMVVPSAIAQKTTNPAKAETIILVHGAWSDSSAWVAVTP